MKYPHLLIAIALTMQSCNTKPINANSDSIVGTWQSIGGEMNGIKVDNDSGRTFIEFDKERITLNGGSAVAYSVDNTKTPATIDIHTTPAQVGILKFANSQLHLCIGKEEHRPTQFKSDEGDNCAYLVMKRIEKEQATPSKH